MMRRSSLLALLALTSALLVTTPVSAASTQDPAAPAATFEWTPGPVNQGEEATVAVTATNLTQITRVYLFRTENYPDKNFERLDYIGPSDPDTVLPLPTDKAGDHSYTVLVGDPPGEPGYITDDEHTLTVTGTQAALDATFPAARLRAGTPAAITGAATGTPGRTVQLQRRARNDTWVPLAETTTGTDGTFTLPAPTWWATGHTLRVYAPATGTDGAVASTTGTLRVTTGTKPRHGRTYTYLHGKTAPARWDPCRPLTYQVNPQRMPAGGLTEIRRALHQVTLATGLRFTYTGKTRFIPHRNNTTDRPVPGADLAIAWATPRQVPALTRTPGIGGAQRIDRGTGQVGELTNGYVVLNAQTRLAKKARANRAAWRQVLLHQAGHVVGLGDVRDKRQVMHRTRRTPASFAAGDLRGLAVVGADAGCFTN